jgi:hypothetical protein
MSRAIASISGLLIASFTVLHLANHFAGHFGLDSHRQWMVIFRKYYQHPVVEAALLASLAVHSAIAVWKKKQLYREKGFAGAFSLNDPAKLAHELSGWFLCMSIPGHVFASRFMASSSGMKFPDITYSYASAVFFPPMTLYYAILAVAGSVHLLSGVGRAARALAPRNKELHSPVRGTPFWLGVLGTSVASVSSVLAVTGFYYRIDVAPGEWDAILTSYRRYWPSALVPAA